MRLYLSSFRLSNRPEEFVRLMGGRKRVAVIANAGDHKTPEDRVAAVELESNLMRGLGLEPSEIDLRHFFGKPDALREALDGYDAVWVRGGNAFGLRRAFRYSGAETIIPQLLAEDKIVYGGYSAGPVILAPSLRGLELVDDPNVIPEGYDPEIVWEGLNVIPYAIAPHYKSDHPESEAVLRVVEHFIDQKIPFVALRDGEEIVVG